MNLTKKPLVAAAAFAAVAGPIVLGIACAPRLRAQPAAPLAFEVASVKPENVRAGSFFVKKILPPEVPFRVSGNRVILRLRTVNDLIHSAYDVQEFQISGAPSWASFEAGDRYDVEAKTPGDAAPTVEQVRLMLQSLLAERFQLKLHRDSKQLPVYHLVIGKGGSKLKPVPPDTPGSETPRSLDYIAFQLSEFLGRPVVNETRISGVFKYSMDWTPILKARREDPDGVAMEVLSPALEKSLGLKLESAKENVVILVIDHVEQPSEN